MAGDYPSDEFNLAREQAASAVMPAAPLAHGSSHANCLAVQLESLNRFFQIHVYTMKHYHMLAFVAATIALDLHAQQPSPPDSSRTASEVIQEKIRAGKSPTQTDIDKLAAARIPAGTDVAEADVAKLAGEGFNRQALYLVGAFAVTAQAGDRAILRFDDKPQGPRIVAVYPPAVPTPAKGTKLVRDKTHNRAFLITEVRKDSKGQIDIWVSDIVRP